MVTAAVAAAALTAGWTTAPITPASADDGVDPAPTAEPTATPAADPTPAPTALGRLELPAHARVYFFGDSWTQGGTAAKGRGYVEVTAAGLGLTAIHAPTGWATGFTHVYPKAGEHRVLYARRAAALKPFTADAIVVQGGLNDIGHSLAGYSTAIRKTIASLREKDRRKGVPVIVVGPAPFSFPLSASAKAVDEHLRAGASANHYYYVSPIKEHWLVKANAGWFIDSRTRHPNTTGHAYYAARLIADIRTLQARTP